jgi:hypothetical protein
MAKLNCESFAERFLIPAFVFFFDMLFPFAWVNDPNKRTAAAAGGCMLVGARRWRGRAASNPSAARSSTIARSPRRMKAQGPIWLGLTERARVCGLIRALPTSAPWCRVRPMPSSAIRRCCWPARVRHGAALCRAAGGPFNGRARRAFRRAGLGGDDRHRLPADAAFYRRSPFWGLAMPLIGVFYAAFTIDSAVQHWRGRGGMWKGRAQAISPT